MRFVITGKVDRTVVNQLNEVMFKPGDLKTEIGKLNLEIDHVDIEDGEQVYYLRESKGPNLLCD